MRIKRPTSFDIAELAGVSQSTVSRALSGAAFVNLVLGAILMAATAAIVRQFRRT